MGERRGEGGGEGEGGPSRDLATSLNSKYLSPSFLRVCFGFFFILSVFLTIRLFARCRRREFEFREFETFTSFFSTSLLHRLFSAVFSVQTLTNRRLLIKTSAT